MCKSKVQEYSLGQVAGAEGAEMKICRDCRYWVSDNPGESNCDEGLCYRFPPLHNPITGFANVHPETRMTSWCGEWKEKK